MSRHRFLFHAPHLDPSRGSVDLDENESHHLARVVRLRDGDAAWVTDGRGTLWRARVARTGRVATLELEADESPAPAPPGPALALARIGTDRFVRAVEQCVELGADAVIPVVCERSRGRFGDGFVARLERVAVAAMKQSFRARRPEIHEPVAFESMLALRDAYESAWYGCAGAAAPGAVRAPLLVAVGPEAGFSEREEAALIEAGFVAVGVGSHRLRSETTAVALVGAAVARAGDRAAPAVD